MPGRALDHRPQVDRPGDVLAAVPAGGSSRAYRDEGYIATLAGAVKAFNRRARRRAVSVRRPTLIEAQARTAA